MPDTRHPGCREQIAQTTDRQALHLAQVLQLAHSRMRAQPSPRGQLVAR